MAVMVGIDFGLKRTGIAVTDAEQRIASPHCTVSSEKLLDWLKSFHGTQGIGCLVLGFPLSLNGEPTHVTQNVLLLKEVLEKEFQGVPVFLQDERYTSKRASRAIHLMGKKRMNKDKELIDKVSAALILQDYLLERENSSN
ncbi:MAG: Holliday junction resolvase RuvX [Bacteroidota bacterium]